MNTKLSYLENVHDLEADAYVERVVQQEGRTVVCLDQTILYPQGGGQPYDTGVIQNEDTKFIVEEVRFLDGDVLHIGHFDGRPFIQGEDVRVTVDEIRHHLNCRLHSAGHLVDMAISQVAADWVPVKGYHFPDGPYVEYEGQLDPEKSDELMRRIEELCNQYVAQDLPVSCRFIDLSELGRLCRYVPRNIPTNKPMRVVQFGDFAVPCGGTHVKSIAALNTVTITKLKMKDKKIRVSYSISQ